MATELDELIVYYKNQLFYQSHQMAPSIQYLTRQTILHLEELRKLKEAK